MRGIYQISIDKYVYIGQSVRLEARQREHLSYLNEGRHHNAFVQRAFDKYGVRPGWFSVLELVPEGEDLTPREQFWIDAKAAEVGRSRVMNATMAADCPMRDPEVAARMVGTRSGNSQWRENAARAAKNRGPEWRENVAEAARNRSPEGRENHARAMRELAETPERRAAHAEHLQRLHADPEIQERRALAVVAANAKHYIFVRSDGEVIEVYNLSAFCREAGLSVANMCNVALGNRASHRGWTRYEAVDAEK